MLAQEMPNARLDVVANASHLVWLDQPDACAEAVAAFLSSDDRVPDEANRS
jgi:pimeloyl-ACP methyl ester carboxylesterase